MTSSVRIIAGRDGTPVPLELIAQPLLAEFAAPEAVLTEFHAYIERILDGNRDWVEIGLPYVKWTLYRCTRAEFALLSTFEGDVTIRTLNQKTNAYHIYNAKCKSVELHADATWTSDSLPQVENVVMTFYDLEEIS